MSVNTEKATVYRGGGRRYFSKGAAIHGEARAAYRAAIGKKDRCGCSWSGDPLDGGRSCIYHDHSEPIFGRYMRYAKHCIAKVTL